MSEKIESKTETSEQKNWTICEICQGRGKKSRGLSKKAKLSYMMALDEFEKNEITGIAPILPKGHLYTCLNCSGSGLIPSENPLLPNYENFPHIAIIGGGIGGIALAVACLHRKIPFTLYERDKDFNTRSQGYGLTLQQATKAIESLGIFDLKEKVISKRHVVHTPDGKIIGEWGMKKWVTTETNKTPRRNNFHIARQSLRLALLEQLGGNDKIEWKHQLLDIKIKEGKKAELIFNVDGKQKKETADLVVGADGIRSTVRKLLIPEETNPLRYLNCIVILGICPLKALNGLENNLLDSATVFQTANGNERIYIMPFTKDSVMWQLSFPMTEEEAINLSKKGAQDLKTEASNRTQWHDPIPQIIAATLEANISGYPAYDREILDLEVLKKTNQITLIGDAAHPMSPFKGQGANQALLDALTLARGIKQACRPNSNWKIIGIRESILNKFEFEMVERSSKKVTDSAIAAQYLHSDNVLQEGDEPRGRFRKK